MQFGAVLRADLGIGPATRQPAFHSDSRSFDKSSGDDMASKKQLSRSKPPAATGRKPYPGAPAKSTKPAQPKRPR
jgi:hypothetical protein